MHTAWGPTPTPSWKKFWLNFTKGCVHLGMWDVLNSRYKRTQYNFGFQAPPGIKGSTDFYDQESNAEEDDDEEGEDEISEENKDNDQENNAEDDEGGN